MNLVNFIYITSVEGLSVEWLLAYIANLLLTFIYIVLFYISFRVVIRNLRKGRL